MLILLVPGVGMGGSDSAAGTTAAPAQLPLLGVGR